MTLNSHLRGMTCPQTSAPPTPSYRKRLRDLLFEIQDMAADADCTPVDSGLKNLLHHANQADESTAKLILDAIHLGEDFACLYVKNFVEFPSAPLHCKRRTYPCK